MCASHLEANLTLLHQCSQHHWASTRLDPETPFNQYRQDNFVPKRIPMRVHILLTTGSTPLGGFCRLSPKIFGPLTRHCLGNDHVENIQHPEPEDCPTPESPGLLFREPHGHLLACGCWPVLPKPCADFRKRGPYPHVDVARPAIGTVCFTGL